MARKDAFAAFRAFLAPILTANRMRPILRFLTYAHAQVYRLSGGAVGARMGEYPVLLLTTIGRKTGAPHRIPLLYLVDGDCFVIAAAFAGSPRYPAWWLNLQQNGDAVVQVNRQTIPVQAELADPGKRRDLWTRLVAMYPDFSDYERRTNREIPVIILRQMKAA